MAGGGENQADGRVNGHIRRWRRYKAPKARRAGGILAETKCGGRDPIVIGRRRWRIFVAEFVLGRVGLILRHPAEDQAVYNVS